MGFCLEKVSVAHISERKMELRLNLKLKIMFLIYHPEMAMYPLQQGFHFHGTPLPGTASPSSHLFEGLACPLLALSPRMKSKRSKKPYEASIADDDEILGQGDDSLEEFFPGEIAPGPPAAMTPDVVEGSEDEVEAPEEPVDGRLQLPEPKAIDRGEAALREEARTLRHIMTHTPKNPFCETCKCAKMYKPTKRSKGESLTVESNKFWGSHHWGPSCD